MNSGRGKSRTSRLRGLVAAVVGVLFLGCAGKVPKKSAPARCTEFGQQCEFEPGKLGSCVARDGCTGDGCLVCQSQH